MDIVVALVAGFVGGLLAFGAVVAVVFRKLSRHPMFKMAKSMSSGPPGMYPEL